MIMAKGAYPKLFSDVELGSWILDFYQQLYRVGRPMAQKLCRAQWLDWTQRP
jgi:iron complex transport system substrate-binding protein